MHLLTQYSVRISAGEDLGGRITSWNAAAVRLYGCATHEIIGKSLAERLPNETVRQVQLMHELALGGEAVDRLDTCQLRVDGSSFAASLSVSLLRGLDGEVAGYATSVQDVTERIRLDAEVEDGHRMLKNQLVKLAHSNRDLEQFAFLASHDLSEPLRIMTGFVQLLERRYSDLLDERGVRYISHVVDGAAQMRALIDDLLEYSRFLRAEEMTDVRIDALDLLRCVASSLDVTNIEVGDLPEVWGDVVAVSVVWRNLISNALKFHRPDETAHIVVTGWEEGSRVVLCVDDDGIGIEPEYRERIFGMFSRLHVREAYAGTGLGLAMVQQIAERSGGRAWAEESPIGGSRFCVSFPAPPAVSAA
jgi:PAS domain S-box-containing protein